jgi:hypothetical protein
MSVFPTVDPVCSRSTAAQGIATVVDARPRDLGAFTVGRVLPAEARRHVGPFVFFDHVPRPRHRQQHNPRCAARACPTALRQTE